MNTLDASRSMTDAADFTFNEKTCELSRGGKIISLCRLHAQIFDCYVKAQAPITVVGVATALGLPKHVVWVELTSLVRRLRPLGITFLNGGSRGRSLLFEDVPKWQPNIAPPARLEGETQ